MIFMDALRTKLASWLAADASFNQKHGRRVRESRNPFSSTDTRGYNELGGRGTNRDLSTQRHIDMLDICYRLFMTNPLARRMINIQVDFIIGSGITPVLDPEKGEEEAYLSEVIMGFWNDFDNNWPIKQEMKCRELILYGEQCYQPFVNEANGRVKLGYIDPAMIMSVDMHPDNPERPGELMLRTVDRKRMAVMWEDPKTELLDGDVFFFRENCVSNANRGYSDLLFAIDWLSALDESLYDVLDNLTYSNMFMFDVTVKGVQGEELDEKAKEIEERKPRAGGTRVHNEDEEWDILTPKITTMENLEALKLVRNMILGGGGFPEHWFGAGGDVNRAVGSVMGIPTYRSLERKQRHFLWLVSTLLRYQCEQTAAVEPKYAKMLLDRRHNIPLHAPRIEEEKYDLVIDMLKTVTDTMTAALDEKWITEESARRIYLQILNRFDVAVDVEKECEKLKKSKESFEFDMEKLVREYAKKAKPGSDKEEGPDGSDA